MRASKRELGLLWRIHGLFGATSAAYAALRMLETDGSIERLDVAERVAVSATLRSMARILAIEEGKQEADLEAWGINLNTLSEVREGRKVRKTPTKQEGNGKWAKKI